MHNPVKKPIEKDIKITQTKIVEKKKEQLTKTITISLPNWPYSKNILMEQIKLVIHSCNLYFIEKI